MTGTTEPYRPIPADRVLGLRDYECKNEGLPLGSVRLRDVRPELVRTPDGTVLLKHFHRGKWGWRKV